MSVESFGRHAKLDDEVSGQVLRLGLASFLAPEADQGGLIVAHDDPGIRAADERTALDKFAKLNCIREHFAYPAIRGNFRLCVLLYLIEAIFTSTIAIKNSIPCQEL